MGLSPVSVDSHCVQAKPPVTPTVRSGNRNMPCEKIVHDPRVLRPVGGRGTPSRPKRGPSRTILAWPLRRRPLPNDAGCVPLREESSSKDFRTGTAPHG